MQTIQRIKRPSPRQPQRDDRRARAFLRAAKYAR